MAVVVMGVGQMILGHHRSLAYTVGASFSINGGKGQMIFGHRRSLSYSGGPSFSINGGKETISRPSSTATVCFFNLSSKSSLRCSSDDNGSFNHHEESGPDEFTVLGGDIPWDTGTVWSTFGFYLFSLHIPLSFGGLSILSSLLHQPVLDPQTQAISLLGIQIFELAAILFLLKATAGPEFELLSIFESRKSSEQRNPWLASALGFVSLVVLVLLTSFVAHNFPVTQTTTNPELVKILQSSNLSATACGIAYCAIIPLLEETIYRGFLLRSISSSMKWQKAVLLSSAIFSAIHFSGENSLQLFIIGCVLGCTYCWTGDLKSSILVHSLYNAMILAITYVY